MRETPFHVEECLAFLNVRTLIHIDGARVSGPTREPGIARTVLDVSRGIREKRARYRERTLLFPLAEWRREGSMCARQFGASETRPTARERGR